MWATSSYYRGFVLWLFRLSGKVLGLIQALVGGRKGKLSLLIIFHLFPSDFIWFLGLFRSILLYHFDHLEAPHTVSGLQTKVGLHCIIFVFYHLVWRRVVCSCLCDETFHMIITPTIVAKSIIWFHHQDINAVVTQDFPIMNNQPCWDFACSYYHGKLSVIKSRSCLCW